MVVEYNIAPQTIIIRPKRVRIGASGLMGGVKVSGKAIESSRLPPRIERIDESLSVSAESIGELSDPKLVT